MRDITEILHAGELEARERFNKKREWSDRAVVAVNKMFMEALDGECAKFIASARFFFISTADSQGNCDCSFRGTEDGGDGKPLPAALALDEKTLLFPDYSGNRVYNSLGNILVNPHIGMLFIDFPSARRLRVNGAAEIIEDPDTHISHWEHALRYVRVQVNQVFWNCSKRIPSSV